MDQKQMKASSVKLRQDQADWLKAHHINRSHLIRELLDKHIKRGGRR